MNEIGSARVEIRVDDNGNPNGTAVVSFSKSSEAEHAVKDFDAVSFYDN